MSTQSRDFNADVFAPFLQSAVTDLVQILGESEILESKRRVAKSLSVVIETAAYRVTLILLHNTFNNTSLYRRLCRLSEPSQSRYPSYVCSLLRNWSFFLPPPRDRRWDGSNGHRLVA